MGGVVEPVSEPYLTIGGIGNDVLIGTFAGEKLRGFAGDDVLDGRGGLDSMYGDAGNDILYYRPGALISGGADIDTLRMDYTTRSTAVSLNFTATNLLVTGIEVISGALSSHNDVIRLGAVTGGDFFINDKALDGGLGFDTLSLDYRTLAGLNAIQFISSDDEMHVSVLNSAGFTTEQNFKSFERIIMHGTNGYDSISFMPGFAYPYDPKIVFYGEGGNDFIQVATNDNVIYGGSGNDRIEVYSAPSDIDRIYGGDGNDLVIMDRAITNLYGGAGIDQLDLSLGASTVGVNLGFVTGGQYRDFETYSGFLTDHDDTVKMIWRGASGSSWSNELDATGGNDTLTLDFGQMTARVIANDFGGGRYSFNVSGVGGFSVTNFEKITVLGTELGDELNSLPGIGTIYGRGGADNIGGGLGNDVLFGGNGDDTLASGNGNDSLHGGEGNDSMVGDYGDDLVIGDAGNDTLEGWVGNDFLIGGSGDDSLDGEVGDDVLIGGTGNDFLGGGYGADKIFGGDGNDTVDGDSGWQDTTASNDSIYGGAGDDLLSGNGSDDLIFGGSGDDRIFGGNGFEWNSDNNRLYGDEGNDQVTGAEGADRLYGGTQNDTLRGGGGQDILSGGDGQDRFIFDFQSTGAGSHARITDYAAGEVLSFADSMITDSSWLTVTVGATNTTVSWYNGTITLLNYTGTLSFAFGVDQPL